MTYNNPSKGSPNKPTPTNPTTNKTTTTSYPQKSKSSSMKTFIPIAVTIGILLLGVIGYMMYNNAAQERALLAKVVELEEAEQMRVELEEQYNQALMDLEEMRGSNDELNILIDQQKEELEEQKNKVAKLIRDSKKRNVAREELDNLKSQIEGYLAQIEELKAQNELLAMTNDSLNMYNGLLNTDLQAKALENDELNQAQAVLVSEKEEMGKTIHFASVVKVKGIQVEGFKIKGSGKPSKKKYAKQVEQLKVCFTTTENEVTQPGPEKFHIRIINPIGETLAIEELGSGAMINKKTEEEIRFTHVKEYDYANDETELCFLWEPNASFQKGTYDVEIYNKGYLAGTGTFSLK